MVAASTHNSTLDRSEKTRAIEKLPVIDLSRSRSEVSLSIVKASEEYGFFKVTNHGVPHHIIQAMEDASFGFFAKPMEEKQRAFGYGSKTIGFNGDMGEVEFLLFQPNDPISIANISNDISHHPIKFSCALSGYVHAVSLLACDLLDLMAEGLRLHDTSVFSRLIRGVDGCDSVFRINHYAPCQGDSAIGFGAHSDPQIITLLRSNGVEGLEIDVGDGAWVPVTPDPTAFCVNVGDALQAMTNGRFVSVRHKVMTNPYKSRMSMAYFCAPPLHATIACLPEMVKAKERCIYRPFTWGEYKKTTYSLRLAYNRLELFKSRREDDDNARVLV